MAEYIDKELALKVTDAVWKATNDAYVAKVWQEIRDLPAADVQEVKHGEWQEYDDYGETVYKCSNCGEELVLIEGTPPENLYSFCPFCGADMKGDKE